MTDVEAGICICSATVTTDPYSCPYIPVSPNYLYLVPSFSPSHISNQNGRKQSHYRSPCWIALGMSRPPRRESQEGCAHVFRIFLCIRADVRCIGLSFEEISQKIGKPEVWTAALFYGQAKVRLSPHVARFPLTDSISVLIA
jgi:hypothetical protein